MKVEWKCVHWNSSASDQQHRLQSCSPSPWLFERCFTAVWQWIGTWATCGEDWWCVSTQPGVYPNLDLIKHMPKTYKVSEICENYPSTGNVMATDYSSNLKGKCCWLMYLASHKMLIPNVSVKCSQTTHFISFMPKYLILQYNIRSYWIQCY